MGSFYHLILFIFLPLCSFVLSFENLFGRATNPNLFFLVDLFYFQRS